MRHKEKNFLPDKPLQLSVPKANTIQELRIPADYLFVSHFPRFWIVYRGCQTVCVEFWVSSQVISVLKLFCCLTACRNPYLRFKVIGYSQHQLVRQRAGNLINAASKQKSLMATHQSCSATRDEPPAAVTLTSLKVAH